MTRASLRASMLFAVLAVAHGIACAQVATHAAPPRFHDAAEEQRYHALAAELRCVMCQNQSLADSNAQIAQDLRHEVLQLMREGKSDAQVKQFLVARYGEFVLYRPRVAAKTWLLWFGPLALLAAGGVAIAALVRRRGGAPVTRDDGQEW